MLLKLLQHHRERPENSAVRQERSQSGSGLLWSPEQIHAYQERHNRSPGHHDEKSENSCSHADPVLDRFLVPASGEAFDCSKDTTAKGFVITVSKEESDGRTKKEYNEITRHLIHDPSVHAALSALRK